MLRARGQGDLQPSHVGQQVIGLHAGNHTEFRKSRNIGRIHYLRVLDTISPALVETPGCENASSAIAEALSPIA